MDARTLPGPNTGTKAEAIRSAASDPRLAAMLGLSKEHQWPEAYTDDLYVWDRNKLAEFPGCDVIWILRDHGTQLIVLDPEAPNPRAENQLAIPVIEYWSGEHFLNYIGSEDRLPKFFYIFGDGTALESDAREARALVSEFYPLNYPKAGWLGEQRPKTV